MKHQTLIFAFSFLGLLSCNEQHDNGNVFNQTYRVNSIPNLDDFRTYNEIEKRMDSINSDYDAAVDSLSKTGKTYKPVELINKRDFRNNRSRIFLKSYTNNNLNSGDFSKHESLPMPCACEIIKDTIYVNMTIGFFGGAGFDIKLFENEFLSSYFEYTDDVKPYKANLQDTSFTDFVIANSKYQSLTINEKPTYKPGQQLTGFLSFTTNNYYTKRFGDKFDTTYVTGKLYFTCKTK